MGNKTSEIRYYEGWRLATNQKPNKIKKINLLQECRGWLVLWRLVSWRQKSRGVRGSNAEASRVCNDQSITVHAKAPHLESQWQ